MVAGSTIDLLSSSYCLLPTAYRIAYCLLATSIAYCTNDYEEEGQITLVPTLHLSVVPSVKV